MDRNKRDKSAVMTVYADRETGACDLFRRCCLNLRTTINKKENALPEIKDKK